MSYLIGRVYFEGGGMRTIEDKSRMAEIIDDIVKSSPKPVRRATIAEEDSRVHLEWTPANGWQSI